MCLKLSISQSYNMLALKNNSLISLVISNNFDQLNNTVQYKFYSFKMFLYIDNISVHNNYINCLKVY